MQLARDKRLKRFVLLALLWLPGIVVLLAVREVLLPFLIAFALAYVIAPAVRFLSTRDLGGRRLPRWGAVILLYVVAFVVLFGVGRIFIPQLYKEVTRLGGEASAAFHALSDEEIAKRAASLEVWVEQNGIPIRLVTAEDTDPEANEQIHDGSRLDINLVAAVQDLIRDAKGAARARGMAAVGQVQGLISSLVRFVFSTFLVLMLTAFILADTERIAGFVFTIVPMSDRTRFSSLMDRVDHGLSGVVRGQLTICLINGLLTLVGLLLLKVKFAFLLASVAAVFSLIPIFGSILSTIPIVIVALSSGASTAVLAVLWIIAIHALEANLLNPKIMGDAAKIHPVLVVLALVTGEHFYGLTGALFAVPLMSIIVTVWKSVRSRAASLDEEIAASGPIPDDDAPAAVAPKMRRVSLRDGG